MSIKMRTWWWLCKSFKRYKTGGPFLCAKKKICIWTCHIWLARCWFAFYFWLHSLVCILMFFNNWHRIFRSHYNFCSPKSNPIRKKFFNCFNLFFWYAIFFSFMTKYFLCGCFTFVGSKVRQKKNKRNSNFEHSKKWFWNSYDWWCCEKMQK